MIIALPDCADERMCYVRFSTTVRLVAEYAANGRPDLSPWPTKRSAQMMFTIQRNGRSPKALLFKYWAGPSRRALKIHLLIEKPNDQSRRTS